MRKYCIVLVKLVLIVNISICQEEIQVPNLFDVFPVSPEAASLGNYGNLPVNLSSGQVNYSIPIYTIKLQGISIPISLSYNYSGYKVSEKSGEVGLGWTLIGGGVISRQVNLKPDEEANGYLEGDYAEVVKRYVDGLLPSDSINLLIEYSAEGLWDTQQDKFNISAPGLSGSMCFNENKEAVFFPFSNYKVEIPNWEYQYSKSISDIIITDDNGNIYTFLSEYREQTIKENLNTNDGVDTYYSAWFLKEIYIPKTNETVEFKYKQYNYPTYTTYSQILAVSNISEQNSPAEDSFNCFIDQVDLSYSETGIDISSFLLDSIIFPGGNVAFIRNEDNGILEKELLAIQVNNYVEEIQKFNFEYANLESSGTNKKLAQISKTNGNDIEDYYYFTYYGDLPTYNEQSLKFSQDFWGYHNGNNNTNLLSSFNTRLPSFDKSLPGALKEIIYPTKGKTLIEYEANEISSNIKIGDDMIQALCTNNMDYSGVASSKYDLNESTIDTIDIPLRFGGQCANYSYAISVEYGSSAEIYVEPLLVYYDNREGESTFQDYEEGTELTGGSLLKRGSGLLNPGQYIVHLNASKTIESSQSFVSYNIDYFDSDVIEVGGIRVKEIKDFSNIDSNTPAKIKKYEYKNSNGIPSGYLLTKGVYNYLSSYWMDCSYIEGSLTNNTLITVENYYSTSHSPLEFYSGGPVYYTNITETFSENDDYGKNTYEYNDIGEIKYSYPYSPYIINNWSRGLLVKQETYKYENGKHVLINKNENKYQANSIDSDPKKPTLVLGFTAAEYKAGQTYFLIDNYLWESYTYSSNNYLLSESTETSFFNNDSIVRKTINEYNKNNLYLNKKTLYENDNKLASTKSYFPEDFNASNPKISSLINNNMLANPIRQEYYRNDNLISGIANIYNEDGALQEVYSYENSQNTYSSTFDENVIKPDNYYLKVNYEYDSLSKRLIEVKEKDNYVKSILWGYNNTLPVTKLENADYNLISSILGTSAIESLNQSSDISFINSKIALLRNCSEFENSLITSYNYNPLVGIISQTDPNNRSTYYEYDGLNRLQKVFDHDKNILKEYNYHYNEELIQAPENIYEDQVSNESIKISWDQVENAEAYNIFRSTNDQGTVLIAEGIAALAYTDYNIEYNNKYAYTLKSLNSEFISDFSQEKVIFSLLNPITQINGDHHVCLNTSINFSVDLDENATDYEWVLPVNATLEYKNKNNVIISFGTGGSNTIKVKAINENTQSEFCTKRVEVYPLPNISVQPNSKVVCENSDVSFSVTADGQGLNYQWQKDGIDIIDETNPIFTINNVQLNDAGNYRCIITDYCNNQLISNVVNLTINTLTIIQLEPGNREVCPGENVSLLVSATGTNLNYQWKENGEIIVGADSPNYSFIANSATYTCVVTGICGAIETNPATVSLKSQPVITDSPDHISVCSGNSATFSVAASGDNLFYQWQYKSDEIIDPETGEPNWFENCVSGTGINSSTFTETSSIGKNGYQYRCVVTGECGLITNSSGANLTVVETPNIPNFTSYITSVCAGNSATFTIGNVSGATSYAWMVPPGATITSNSGTSITVRFGTSSGNVSVRANNSCFNSAYRSKNVTVINVPDMPDAIIGNSNVCKGSSINYSISEPISGTTYTWTVPSGSTITSDNGTSITVQFGSSSGNVSVRGNNSCFSGAYRSKNVTVTTAPPTPGSISGSTSVCSGSSATYSISSVSGATSYTWTVPPGATITLNSGTSITVRFGTSSGNVSVRANNSCFSSTYRSKNVTVTTTPPTPGSISGSTSVCSGSSATYSISSVSGATSYTWMVPPGATITSNSGTSITVHFGTSSGNVSVRANNSCFNSSYRSIGINVISTPPNKPGLISGSSRVTPGSTYVFNIQAVTNADFYTWTLPSDWSIDSGQGTTGITVTVGTRPGQITVKACNCKGCSTIQTKTPILDGGGGPMQ